MADVERLIKAGSTLGLAGEELNNWVTTQWAEQEKKRKEEIDMLKMEKEKNWEKQQLVEKELELERLRMERQVTSPSASLASSPREHEDHSSRRSLARSPKLPCFDDKQDQ
ncbi:hypothetical protein RRG08_047584 [Elysia crispata]|uniref:Uncharacterized protein n=1 Tax=Elysia crispata TaxID=231223 RepID=A0AAE1CJC9_9GAST|nr:hypothetical protein RRG08_047584 [Elysia crispata]